MDALQEGLTEEKIIEKQEPLLVGPTGKDDKHQFLKIFRPLVGPQVNLFGKWESEATSTSIFSAVSGSLIH